VAAPDLAGRERLGPEEVALALAMRRGGVPFGLWLRGLGHLAQLAAQSVALWG
jgi:hypothetical protein